MELYALAAGGNAAKTAYKVSKLLRSHEYLLSADTDSGKLRRNAERILPCRVDAVLFFEEIER